MVHGLREYLTLRVALSNPKLFWVAALKLGGLLLLPIFLSACAASIVAFSGATTATASSAGTAATTAAVANPATAASLASTVSTGKSPLEHATSAATKMDCSLFNLVGGKAICVEVSMPGIKDKSEPYPGPADQTRTSSTK
jgi:hypothetical protein